MSNKAWVAGSIGGAIVSWLPVIETTVRIFGSVVALIGGIVYLLIQIRSYRKGKK